jgi:hypothetical protein
MTLGVMRFFLKKDKYQPIAVCEVKLNYLHIYVHSHYQKEYLIKSCILFLFWKSMLNVFLSR